jgi:hypothetical protein
MPRETIKFVVMPIDSKICWIFKKVEMRASFCGMILVSCIYLMPQFVEAQSSVCAEVRLSITQQAVIAGQAFSPKLAINNGSGTDLQQLSVNLDITDINDQSATNLFVILPPSLSGVTAVDGTGLLSAGTTGQATWTIRPTQQAAPTATTEYFVSGTLSYLQNGILISIPLFPTSIQVLPQPWLTVKYFLERTVYGQDLFSTNVESPVPFNLGLLVTNGGYGTAKAFTITSGQPQIVDNSKGLLVSFQIVSSQAGSNVLSPSLTLNLGDITHGQTAFGRWLMTASLQGTFTNFSASYVAEDDLGNTNLSVVAGVETHALIHAVRVDQPNDDGLPDFLVNDIPNPAGLPETVYCSDGPILPVVSVTNAIVTGAIDSSNLQIQLSSDLPAGWVYLQIPNPGQGKYTLAQVVRSDGHVVRLGDNAWTTQQTLHPPHEPAYTQDFLRIFDYNSTGNYTVSYAASVPSTIADPLFLVSSENPSGYKDSVSFTASVTPAATGNVLFLTNGVAFGTAPLINGSATSAPTALLPSGTNIITAEYGGDNNYSGSTNAIDQIVTNQPPVASPLFVTRTAGTTLKIPLSSLATNWSDAYGLPVSLIGVNFTSTNGQHVFALNLTTNNNGSYVITNTAYLGYVNPSNVNDQITYAIGDGLGDTNEGWINVVVSTSPLFGQTTGVLRPNGRSVTLNFAGQPGYRYSVQRSLNLATWVTIWTTNAPPAGPFKYTDTFGDLGGAVPASAYYRLTWNP